jgi:hypothetical protein
MRIFYPSPSTVTKRTCVSFILLAFVGSAMAGCSRVPFERVPVYPVSGQLFIHGQPAVKARIQLHALDDISLDRFRPHAIVQADGSFQLTTFTSEDGAPAGKYAITVIWPASPKRRFDAEGPDRLKGRYADPRRPLRKVEITPGEIDLGRLDIN